MQHETDLQTDARAATWNLEAASRSPREFSSPNLPSLPDRSFWIYAPAARLGGPESNRFVHPSRGDGRAATSRLIDDYANGPSRAAGIIEADSFGVSPDRLYRFDAVIECLLSGHYHLLTGWHDNVRRIIDSGLRFVTHIGKIKPDRSRTSDEVVEIVLDFMVRTVPGVEICFDAGVGEPEGSQTHEVAKMLRAEGVSVWIEALALAGRDSHWAGFNQWCLDRELRRYAQHGHRLEPLDRMGKTVVVYTGHEQGSTPEGDAYLAKLLGDRLPEIGRGWEPWHHATFSSRLASAGPGGAL